MEMEMEVKHTITLTNDDLSLIRIALRNLKTQDEKCVEVGTKIGLRLPVLNRLLNKLPRVY